MVWLLLTVLPGLAVPHTAAGAEALEVPAPSQVPIFLKLLTYDRALSGQSDDPLHIGILIRPGDEDSRRCAETFVTTLEEMSSKTINGRPFRYEAVEWETAAHLEELIREREYDIIYVTTGHGDHVRTVRAVTRELDVLSLGAESAYVGAGVSIGLGLHRNRPQIWVNLESLHQEGHPLDARILRLCKVVPSE